MTDAPHEYVCRIGFSHESKNAEPLRFEPGDLVVGVPDANCRALAAQNPAVVEAVATVAKPAAKRKATKATTKDAA